MFVDKSECPLVSVIVPVYNVEKYIARCVKSIISQDYQNLQILLVDDGSKDASRQILDTMAMVDSRIQVIHQENAGVSTARNVGLQAALGEYIFFVDGDDYLEEDCVSYFVKMMINTNCNIAISKYNFTWDNKEQVQNDYQIVIDSEKIIEDIYLMKINVAVWNKMYNHLFLKENNIRFNPDFWYGEGMLFNIECLQQAEQVAVGERKVYYQVHNPKSAMRDFNLESNYCGIRSLEYQKKKWIKTNKNIENAWVYHYRCFSNSILCGLVKTNTVQENRAVYKKCIRNLRKDIMVPLRVNISIKQKLYYLLAMVCPVLLAKRRAWKDQRISQLAIQSDNLDGIF